MPLLGAFRFFLSVMVAAEHLLVVPGLGMLAVEAFFTISGFLVTMIATGVYQGRPHAYLLNRFLRIFPVYWACLAIAVVALYTLPPITLFDAAITKPGTLYEWAAQIAVVGNWFSSPVRVLPTSWTLTTELVFYIAIGLFTAHHRILTLSLVPITTAVAVLAAFGYLPFGFYGSPIGNAHSFLIGSFAWQLCASRPMRSRPREQMFWFAVYCLFSAAIVFVGEQWGHIEMIATPFVVSPLLVAIAKSPFRGKLAPQMILLGKLSYPLFLIHWVIASSFSTFTGVGAGWPLFLMTFAIAVPASYAVYWLVERPIERLRSEVRSSQPAPRALPQVA